VSDNRDTRPRFDRFRWWLLRRIVPKMNDIELLGYIAANAGYTDRPDLTPEHFHIDARGA